MPDLTASVDAPAARHKSLPKNGRRPKSPAFQLYPADLLSDLRFASLSTRERGVWLTLICHEWINGPLPTSIQELSRILPGSVQELEQDWKMVSRCFVERDGGLVNPRLERERDVQTANREACRAHSQHMNRARWGKKADSDPAAIGDPARMPTGLPRESCEPPSRIPYPVSIKSTPYSITRGKRGGGKGTPLTRWWDQEWQRTRGESFEWSTKEAVALASAKKALAAHHQDPESELAGRISAFVESTDAWVARNCRPTILLTKLNDFSAGALATAAAPKPDDNGLFNANAVMRDFNRQALTQARRASQCSTSLPAASTPASLPTSSEFS